MAYAPKTDLMKRTSISPFIKYFFAAATTLALVLTGTMTKADTTQPQEVKTKQGTQKVFTQKKKIKPQGKKKKIKNAATQQAPQRVKATFEVASPALKPVVSPVETITQPLQKAEVVKPEKDAKWAAKFSFSMDPHFQEKDSDANGDYKDGGFTLFNFNLLDNHVLFASATSSIKTPEKNKANKQYDTRSSKIELGVLPKAGEDGLFGSLALGHTNMGTSDIMSDIMTGLHKAEGFNGERVSPDSCDGHILVGAKAGYTKNVLQTEIATSGWFFAGYGEAVGEVGTDRVAAAVTAGAKLTNNKRGKFSPSVPTQKKGEVGLFAEVTGSYVPKDVVTDKSGTNTLQAEAKAGIAVGLTDQISIEAGYKHPLTNTVKDAAKPATGMGFVGLTYRF